MYNDDTRDEYFKLLDYVESKYESIKDNEDFKNKFQELLETDEEFKNMINKFNNVNVYNEDRVNSADDYLTLGEKLFPVSEEIENIDELIDKLKELNPSESFEKNGDYMINSSISMNDSKLKLPKGFYYNKKNGITNKHNTKSGRYIGVKVNELNKTSDEIKINKEEMKFDNSKADKIVNAIKGATKTVGSTIAIVINGISACFVAGAVLSGLFNGYSIATIASMAAPFLVIQGLTAGFLLYKGVKSGSVQKWFKKFGKKSNFEPSKENVKDKINTKEMEKETEKILMPFDGDINKAKEEIEKSRLALEEKNLKISDEIKEVPPVPVFKKEEMEPLPLEHDETLIDTSKEEIKDTIETPIVVTPNIVEPDLSFKRNEYDKPVVGRHVKKSQQNLEDGYKTHRISELESEINRLEDVKRTLTSGAIFKEDEERQSLVSRMINDNNKSLEKTQKELNDLKGVKEEKNMATLLRSRKATLTGKLSKLENNKENEELRNQIKAAISQIDKYINLDKQVRNNTLATDADKARLAELESTTYITTEYVLDESKKSKRGKK